MSDCMTCSSPPPQKPSNYTNQEWRTFEDIIDDALAVDLPYCESSLAKNLPCDKDIILEIMDIEENSYITDRHEIPVNVTHSTDNRNCKDYFLLGENKDHCSATVVRKGIIRNSYDKNQKIATNLTDSPIINEEHESYTKPDTSNDVGNEKQINMSQNSNKKLTKKRLYNPKNWKQNQRKIKRQCGEEYTNSKGFEVPKRIVCEKMCRSNSKCPFKCSQKISKEERELIHRSFWKLSDGKKVHFYSKHIKRYIALRKRRKSEVSKKAFSYKYTFIISSACLQVCQEYFLNTLNISKQRVYYVFKNCVNLSTGLPRTPLQGKHPKKVIPVERKDQVRAHIKSFPTVPSHYSRANTNKQYLERNLSLKRMYELYFQFVEDPVKFNIYEHIFRTEFNISFFKPKKDNCDKCTEYKMNRNATTKQTEDSNRHVIRKQIGYKERNSDRVCHESNNTVEVVTFDLQNTFSLPKSNISKHFYKMKLCCYNLTAHLSINGTVYNAIWHEALCGRAGIHIASAMIKILKDIIKENPKIQKLILWSDSCIPQNKNSIRSFALQQFLQTEEAKNLEVIEQKFGEPGYGNVQEIDNAHICIERYLRNLDIWSPLTLIRLLLKIPSTWKLKFKIIQMTPKDYLDYQSFSAKYTYNLIPYTRVKHLVYIKKSILNINYRESFEGKVNVIKLNYARRINLQKQVALPDYVPQIVLKSAVVPELKKKHLLEMLPQMPEEERIFYSELLGARMVKQAIKH